MNCSYHPNKKASAQCSACRKLLCDDCADRTEGKAILCSHCQVTAAISDCVKSDIQRLQEKKQKEPQEKEAENKNKQRQWVIIGIVVLLVLMGNGLIYYFTPNPQPVTFAPHSHPMAAAVLIDAGIKDYAKDHGGSLPESLEQLYGKYLPQQIFTPAFLKRFDYKKASDKVYELVVRTSDNTRMPDVRFTQGGSAPSPTQ